jgi:nucleotide-binding universal stress UspA family protein
VVSIRRILCPTDLSTFSERALHHALALARAHGASLTVLHVEHVLLASARDAIHLEELPPTGHAAFRRFLDARRGGTGEMQMITATGDPVREILARARDEAPDLIVMGTHGRSGLARTLLGSVTEAVVRQSPCPVMTIPPAIDTSSDLDVPSFDPILCASAFSPSCRLALDTAISIAQDSDARVIVAHAVHDLTRSGGGASGFSAAEFSAPFNAVAGRVPTTRRGVLARLRRGLPPDTVFRCQPELAALEGRPAEALLELAAAERVRLIVLGVQTRNAIDRLLFGSTTREVLRSATCPVLSVRADDTAAPWDWPPHAEPDIAATMS